MSTELSPTQQKIVAQQAYAIKTGVVLPALAHAISVQTTAAVRPVDTFVPRSFAGQAPVKRFNIFTAAMKSCAAAFGVKAKTPAMAEVMSAFSDVPTDKLSDEIAASYQLQLHYDRLNK